MENFKEGDIVEDENFRGDPKSFGFKEIIMLQVQRVVSNASKEMRKGYWIKSQAPNQISQNIKYVGDSRRELTQSINALHDLLMAKFDKAMTKQSEEITKEIEEISTEEGWTKRLKVYRKMSQQLFLFLDRKGWLKAGEIID